MRDDESGIDPSIQLIPLNEPISRPKARWRLVPCLLVGAAVLLSLSVVTAIVVKLASALRDPGVDVSVAAQRDSATERAETVAVFSAFDATEASRLSRSPEEKQERESIEEFFFQVQGLAAAGDNAGFRKLVDFDRFLKRIELTGGMRGWSSLDKRIVRTELKTSIEVEPIWAKLVVAGAVAPADEMKSRIVYVYGRNAAGDDQTECRFWVVRDGDEWKIYDWERLDLGLSQSQEWSLYCTYANTPAMEGFRRWGNLVGEADEQSVQGNSEAAEEKLRLAELEQVPPGFDDYRWLLTGYRWAALNELADAERCYANIKQPDDSPGAYLSLMQGKRWTSPAEALEYAEQYEAVSGPGPDLLKTKAALLERLNRNDEAIEQWKKLLRIEPDNTQALAKLYIALPPDDKTAFEAHLARLEDPAAAAVRIASTVGYRNYKELLSLAAYLQRSAPGQPGTLYVSGLAQQLNGENDAAADLFRQAFTAENDKETRDSYIASYVEAMVASGRVIEAIDSLPDSEAALESLFYQFDDDDISLTKEEYSQLTAFYMSHYPKNLDAILRSANLDIQENRYENAERTLRAALVSMPATDIESHDGQADEYDEDESYRSSFEALLARSLWKSGKLRDAYESGGDRRNQFARLARSMIQEERWDDARQLLAMHQASVVDDPEIASIEGELAAHEKRWDDAIRHFERALESTPADERRRFEQRLPEVYVDAGKWLEYCSSHEDDREAFENLADRLVSDGNWEALAALIAAHRSRFSDDPRIAKFEAAAAWERGDFVAYARSSATLLASNDENVVAAYQRNSIESRRLHTLLQNGSPGEAMELARERQRKNNDVTLLAIVKAATGDLADAKRLAREAADAGESITEFYSHDDVGRIFLDQQFADLQHDFPVELPYSAASTLAVFLSDRDWQLEAADIGAALRELGVDTPAIAEPLETMNQRAHRAFAVRFDGGSVWFVTGEGKFDTGWKLDADRGPIADKVNTSDAWLAVGVATWTEAGRKRIEALSRRLAATLADQRYGIFCAPTRNTWEGFRAYEVTPALMFAWQSSGKLHSFASDGVSLISTDRQDNVAAERQFERSLRGAVRAYEASPERRFEVWAGILRTQSVDPLRLRVTSVRRAYGSLEFDGTLQNQPLLFSELKPGLSMRLHQYEIQAFRLDDSDPVYQP